MHQLAPVPSPLPTTTSALPLSGGVGLARPATQACLTSTNPVTDAVAST